MIMDRMTEIMYASHQGSWAFIVILFIASYILLKTNKAKAGQIVQMILRVFYLIMVISGIGMLIGYKFPLAYTIKGILAIILISFMEMACARVKRNEKSGVQLIVVAITLVIVILMGFGVISF